MVLAKADPSVCKHDHGFAYVHFILPLDVQYPPGEWRCLHGCGHGLNFDPLRYAKKVDGEWVPDGIALVVYTPRPTDKRFLPLSTAGKY